MAAVPHTLALRVPKNPSINTYKEYFTFFSLRLILRSFRIHPLLCYSFYIKVCMLQEWVTRIVWFLELKADQTQYYNVYLKVFTLLNITGHLAWKVSWCIQHLSLFSDHERNIHASILLRKFWALIYVVLENIWRCFLDFWGFFFVFF